MEIQLLHNQSDKRKINKSISSEKRIFVDVYLLETTDIINPSFILTADFAETAEFNYLYAPTMKRYYYITTIKSLDNERVRIDCHCDVLMTFKDDIMNAKVNVIRSTAKSLPLVADSQIAMNSRQQVILKKFSGCEFAPTINGEMHSIVLTTI